MVFGAALRVCVLAAAAATVAGLVALVTRLADDAGRWLLFLTAAAVVIAVLWLHHMIKRHGALVILARWHIGESLDGQRRTNASRTRRATKALHVTGHAHPWHWLPANYRAGIRIGAELAAVLVAYGLIRARTITLVALLFAVVTLTGLGVLNLVYKIRDWRHNRDWVNPLNDALPPGVTVAELTRDRTRTVLALPLGFTGDDKDKKLIMQAAAAKLSPSGELSGDWSKLHGKKPQVSITLIEPPPGYVSFADIRELADAAAEHEIVLGLGRKGAPGIVSVDNDSPHIGLSMGSGDGKSVTARNSGSQLAHHGAIIAVLDPKLMSQHWAAGLPNVAYARTPEEIHVLAIWLASEVDRRNQVALYNADVEGNVHASVGPRIAAFLEELNITQAALTAYWKSIGGKGRSPAVAALDKVAFSGRAVNVNLVYIGQRLSAKATSGGSGDARENLGVLLMSNPAASTWKMLVGDRHALPPATDVRGRLQVVTAKTVTEVQGAYVTGAQARDYATSGIVAVPRDDMPCVGGLAPVGTPERAAQDVPDRTAIGAQGPDLHIVPDSPRPVPPAPRVTIADAVAEGISGPSVEAVRKALQRDTRAPEPVGRRGNADEYDRTEWCDWEEARRQPRRLVRR